jgi:hypothetical protein
MKNTTFIIVFALIFSACNQFEELNKKDVIGMVASDNIYSIPADNTSNIKVTAYISNIADIDKREIEFITEAGTFVENSKQTLIKTAKDTLVINNEEYLSTSVVLKANNSISENVKVTAKIYEYSSSLHVGFTESIPNSLKISANVFGIDNTFKSEALLTVNLRSETGFPSSGNQVEFLVLNASDNKIFTNAKFREQQLTVNATGQASTLFTAGNLMLGANKFEGELKIIGRLKNMESIADTLTINIYKPL